jgi:P-type E1-E2 ATPase
MMLVSGDHESEVKYLAESVAITEVHAGKSPEEKVVILTEETSKARTLFVGDGINDAPPRSWPRPWALRSARRTTSQQKPAML